MGTGVPSSEFLQAYWQADHLVLALPIPPGHDDLQPSEARERADIYRAM